MFVVYILKSESTGKFYIGYTSNINERLKRHNQGRNRSTKSGRPWKIIYKEFYNSKKEALEREGKIKSYKGGSAFKKLIFNSELT